MPAYLIVTRRGPVKDQEAYDQYVGMNAANPSKVPLELLVMYGATQVLEGDAPDGMVMLKFDSAEQARAWYESPEYQAALPHRLRCGDWQAFIVEGV
jgi:uncharacterized protein (DUF1330 family)